MAWWWVSARNSSPCVLIMAQNWRFMACWASFFADRQSWAPAGRVVLRRGPGSRALLLAVLTLQCAATPYWWHGGQPAHAATYRVNVRMKGPRQPPVGLTCAWMLACPGDMSCVAGPQSPVSGVGRLASIRTSRDMTEAGPRRIPPLVACGGPAVDAGKSTPESERWAVNARASARQQRPRSC